MVKNYIVKESIIYFLNGLFAWFVYALIANTLFYFLVWKFPIGQYPLYVFSLLPGNLIYGYPYTRSIVFFKKRIKIKNKILSLISAAIFGGFWWAVALTVFYFLLWGFPIESYLTWFFTLAGSLTVVNIFYNPAVIWFNKKIGRFL